MIRVIVVIVALTLAVIYHSYNPENVSFFPPCPFHYFTGYQCPGCGSQRAAHLLLNGNVLRAFRMNPLFVVAIPYVLGGFLLDYLKPLQGNLFVWRNRLYGKYAIWTVFVLIVLFWMIRLILHT